MKKSVIDIIYNLIINDQAVGLFDFIVEIQNVKFTSDDLQEFIDLFNPYLKYIDKPIEIGLSGSGGSGIRKPNIGTIASMYLSQVSGITVVKVGSKKRTSLMGSTDFLSKLGYQTNVDKVEFYKKWGFMSVDIEECAKWRKYEHILRINKSFNSLFDTYIINPELFMIIPLTVAHFI